MAYQLNDPLSFGKYEGFTIEEIYCGQDFVFQGFIDGFLMHRMTEETFTLTTSDAKYKTDVTVSDVNFFLTTKFVSALLCQKAEK